MVTQLALSLELRSGLIIKAPQLAALTYMSLLGCLFRL